jgi:hypothetical protein
MREKFLKIFWALLLKAHGTTEDAVGVGVFDNPTHTAGSYCAIGHGEIGGVADHSREFRISN